jgi:hypothetical protein
MPSVNPTLRRIFADHGVRLVEEADWLTTGGRYPACRGTTDPRESGDGFRARLDVELALDERRTVVESFSDFGATAEDAERNSLFNFCQSSLHVALSAFWNVHDDARVLREEWRLGGGRWRATIGNFVRKALDGADVPVPGDLLAAVEAAARSRALPRSVHWVRVYFANVVPSDRITEVLLDGEPWEGCAAAVGRLDWPALDFFYSCRLFLTLQPVG